MRLALASTLIVACYVPHPEPGSPCSDTQPCPSPLVCSPASQTCQDTSVASDGPPSNVDGPIYLDAPPILIDGCSPSPEICGDGIDQDCDGVDPPCPTNDGPSGAIDITAGGTFTGDLRYAHDDAGTNGSTGCGQAGGRDLYYTITPPADEVYYLDTFGSNFDTVIRIYPGACQTGYVMGSTCRNDSCGGALSQFSGTVPAGTNCVVIDQKSSAETNGSVVLHVERGHRNGTRLSTSAANTGTTCSLTDLSSGTACGAGAGGGVGSPDYGYFFTLCPTTNDTLTASTCNAGTDFDTDVYVLGPGAIQITGACNDDDPACAVVAVGASTVTGVHVTGAHLFWVIVDGDSPATCGNFSLTATLM